MYQYPITPDEIYHHGILGQRWGKKNGPPYPLSSTQKSSAEKKAMTDEEKTQYETEKARVLREGSAIEVRKYANELTTKEIEDAINRIKKRSSLDELAQKELDFGWETTARVMKKVGNVKDWSKIGVELWKIIDEFMNLLDKDNKGRKDNGK